MNSNQDLENTYEPAEDFGFDDGTSVDDFIRQLEAKEKDLHISSDLVIEIDEADFDDTNVPDFLATEFSAPPPKEKAKALKAPPLIAVNQNQKTFSELESEITVLKNQVSKMEAERAEIFENSRRRQKDFENYKSRTERERSETFTNQMSNLATQILPVLDNMDRALNFAIHVPDDKADEFRQFFDGIMMVNQQLNDVLAEMGIFPISAVGKKFDPHLHEAVAMEETEKFPPNTISAELMRGYRIGDRVIRASMVKVAAPVKNNSAKPDETHADDIFQLETE